MGAGGGAELGGLPGSAPVLCSSVLELEISKPSCSCLCFVLMLVLENMALKHCSHRVLGALYILCLG